MSESSIASIKHAILGENGYSLSELEKDVYFSYENSVFSHFFYFHQS